MPRPGSLRELARGLQLAFRPSPGPRAIPPTRFHGGRDGCAGPFAPGRSAAHCAYWPVESGRGFVVGSAFKVTEMDWHAILRGEPVHFGTYLGSKVIGQQGGRSGRLGYCHASLADSPPPLGRSGLECRPPCHLDKPRGQRAADPQGPRGGIRMRNVAWKASSTQAAGP